MNFESFKSFVCDVLGIYVLWIVIHYICANLYPQFCAENSFWGFIKSVFVSESPHCIAMRWVIYNSGNIIHNMWLSVGVWFSGKLIAKGLIE